ncbi:hypothetical protein pipiens_007604 [Culex pipiens pipiens]|uniref:Uncharacterized protein n=2 Tax=Culex pipiens TaxID=7175 RepID=A0ABD1DKR2_CULPP
MSDKDMRQLIKSGLVPAIVSSLAHTQDQVKVAALEVIHNLFRTWDLEYDVGSLVLRCGILSHYGALLSHPNDAVRSEALHVLTFVCISEHWLVREIITEGILGRVVELVRNDPLTHGEAVSTLSQIVSRASPVQLPELIKLGAITLLLEELDSDGRVSNIIRECGGLASIVHLADHGDELEGDEANEIIAKFFPSARNEAD